MSRKIIIKDRVVRFRENKIISDYLSPLLNEIMTKGYEQRDIDELYKLIGYSLSGYSSLTCISDKERKKAKKILKRKASECED